MQDDDALIMLRESARRSLAAYPATLGLTQADSIDPDALAQAHNLAVEQGWLGVLAPERLGGLDLGMPAAMILAEEAGRALLPGALLANLVLLPTLAGVVGGESVLDNLVASMIGGQARVVMLVTEGRLDEGNGRCLVMNGEGATELVHLQSSDRGLAEGFLLRCIRGVTLTDRSAFDPTAVVGELNDGYGDGKIIAEMSLSPEQAKTVLAPCHLWIAAELLGVADRAGEMSIAYAQERKQFGVTIGSYQAVKHRIVDDYVLRENARAMIREAAGCLQSADQGPMLMAQATRAAATRAAISSTAHCIQVHGAIGFSWEHPAHLYYKRARQLDCTLGSGAESLKAVGELLWA